MSTIIRINVPEIKIRGPSKYHRIPENCRFDGIYSSFTIRKYLSSLPFLFTLIPTVNNSWTHIIHKY